MEELQEAARVIPNRATPGQRLSSRFLYGILYALSKTWRVSIVDPYSYGEWGKKEPGILCVWHNRLIMGMTAYREFIKPMTGRRIAAMVSASNDGAFLARILVMYDVEPVYGSTSRRGRQALLEMTRLMKRGLHLAITPDGPRGPCYVIQDGILALAQVTGLPIVPLGGNADRKVRFRSWDRFQMPLPLARCQLSFGEPLRVPRDIDVHGRESLRRELHERMQEINPN